MGNLLEKYEILQTIRLSGKIRNITDINFLTFFFINLLCLFIFYRKPAAVPLLLTGSMLEGVGQRRILTLNHY